MDYRRLDFTVCCISIYLVIVFAKTTFHLYFTLFMLPTLPADELLERGSDRRRIPPMVQFNYFVVYYGLL
jgi:hypothetical protein